MRPEPTILFEMPRKRPGWLRYVLAFAILVASGFWFSALAFDFQPHEVADRPEIPFEIVIQSREATANTCASILREATRIECATIHDGKCTIYMTAVSISFSWRSQQKVLRHAYWHCNGGTHERRGRLVLAPSPSTGDFALMQDRDQ